MGRSSQTKALENRTKIVETAAALFREFGVDQVSVAAIMTANDMTVGGFYKHFDSKDALVAEAFSLAFDHSREAWDGVFSQADRKTEDRSVALVRQYLLNKSARRRCPLLAFAPHIANGSATAASKNAYKAGTKELLDKFLNEAGTSGTSADEAEAQRNALVLFAAMVGARAMSQAVGNTEWMLAIEAAINEAAAH
ncbi:TetR/AcrR family transcriptional regulator [Pseudomonas sp. BN102]|uniref:TetR/AcrR family transcriptional regulator n=1 Tax=Pseudomonas sp. BN102 TaxID=2567886 RepID=UPI002458E0FE|nr:TetR/AcrR family transcriptional regulator [Pseudomonas sp. BN102]MDH4612697.1 TetR/AcrR family transcriptional regulator [Pseudomonas sp. BN102]